MSTTTTTTTPQPLYELTLQDLIEYVAREQDYPINILGFCHSACSCLGASALEAKYPGHHFYISSAENLSFRCTTDTVWKYTDLPIEPKVSAILCAFDWIFPHRLPEERGAVTYAHLYEVAHDGRHPALAQLFSSPSSSKGE